MTTWSFAYLNGQSNEIFDLPVFYHLNQPGPLTNGFKYFKFWFSLLYSNFSESPRSIILRRVSLPTV